MTIAACYLSREGVVFGADSTTTVVVGNPNPNNPGAEHHFNFAQKIFQIGQNSSFGIVTWGLGSLQKTSYRSLIALLGDRLTAMPSATMAQITATWSNIFWNAYQSEFAAPIAQARLLATKANRTPDE